MCAVHSYVPHTSHGSSVDFTWKMCALEVPLKLGQLG